MRDAYLTTNTFEAEHSCLSCPVDLFSVEGAFPVQDRFRLLGKAAWELHREYGGVYAQYQPMAEKPMLIGFPSHPLKDSPLPVGGMTVRHQARGMLEDAPGARQGIRRLLYEVARDSVERAGFWEHLGGVMYPKKPIEDRKNNLLIFHGFDFQIGLNRAGIPTVTIDVTAHYVQRSPFFDEIRDKGRDLRWFQEELDARRKEYESQRRTSKGVYFYYSLLGSSVPVDGFDPRPISGISLPEDVMLRGRPFSGTVSEYLRANYADHPSIGSLEANQPGLRGGKYVYPPQFVHRHLSLDEVPRGVLQEHSYLSAPDPSRRLDPVNAAAVRRYTKIREVRDAHFSTLQFGPLTLHFRKAISRERTHEDTFPKPRLQLNPARESVRPEELKTALGRGGFHPPKIDELFLWSDDTVSAVSLWNLVRRKMARMFGLTLPPKYTPLTASQDLEAYLGSRLRYSAPSNAVALCVLSESGDEHDMLYAAFGRLGVSVQCVEKSTAHRIVGEGRESFLEGICAGIYAKAGGVPWILHDRLHYDRYVALDIGRKKSEHWAMAIVSDQLGTFAILPGDQTVGEDLEAAALQKCVRRAVGASPPETLIVLRDGEVPSKNEVDEFEAIVRSGPVRNAAIAAVLKGVPNRIFRQTGREIQKPQSGDHIPLEPHEISVCCAGVDEYGQGVPKPKLLHVYGVKGTVDPLWVAEDFFKMSYLNYGSPGRSYSTAGPLELAHRLAAELSRGVPRAGPPF